jgi:hypothetical protein
VTEAPKESYRNPHEQKNGGEVPACDDELGVEIIDSHTRYGRLLGGAATNEYILRVYLRFSNGTQQPVLVTSLAMTLDGQLLNRLSIPGPSLPVLLTSKGQEQLHTNKVYSEPYTIPSATTQERYAFFQLPADFGRESLSLACTATVISLQHRPKEIQFVVYR